MSEEEETASVVVRDSTGVVVGDNAVVNNFYVNSFAHARFTPPTPAPLTGREVARPELIEQAVSLLCDTDRTERNCLGIVGSGGFGKTTLVRLLYQHQTIRRRFEDGLIWLSLGPDLQAGDLASRINGLITQLTGIVPPFADAHQAGDLLGKIIADRKVLLVIDDAWSASQVTPLLLGARQCRRIVVARRRSAFPEGCPVLTVGGMTTTQARELLVAHIEPTPSEALVDDSLAIMANMPLLLALANGAVRADVRIGREPNDSLGEVIEALQASGLTALDVTDTDQKELAVAETIKTSLRRLDRAEQERFKELAVFPAGSLPTRDVLEKYWQATGGWTPFQTHRFCMKLLDHSLITDYRIESGVAHLALHDVIRAFLEQLSRDSLPHMHAALLQAHRAAVESEPSGAAWWNLPSSSRYLWTWVPFHLRAAGLAPELETCLSEPLWVERKISLFGVSSLEADLRLSAEPATRALLKFVQRNAHLLTRLEPSGSLLATIASRTTTASDMHAFRDRTLSYLPADRFEPATPLPDLPHVTLDRTLPSGTADHVLFDPRGRWLATADWDIQLWDLATGERRHAFTSVPGRIMSLACAPDGSWLASGDGLGRLRVRDTRSGELVYECHAHTPGLHGMTHFALAVTADGSLLASAGSDGHIRLWETGQWTGPRTLAELAGATGLAIAPDGTWLAATANREAGVRVWDLAAASGPVTYGAKDGSAGSDGLVIASPDGTNLAWSVDSGSTFICDARTGENRRDLRGDSAASALTFLPGQNRLAVAEQTGDIRVWDVATGDLLQQLSGHVTAVRALVASPDGTWLASTDITGCTQVWSVPSGMKRTSLWEHVSYKYRTPAAAVSPDGGRIATAVSNVTRIWDAEAMKSATDAPSPEERASPVISQTASRERGILAVGRSDGTVELWDLPSASLKRKLRGHDGAVTCLAFTSPGTLLASGGPDGFVRVWDPETGDIRRELNSRDGHPKRELLERHGSLPSPVSGVTFLNNDSWVAAALQFGTVMWDAKTGQLLNRFSGDLGQDVAVAASPAHDWIAAASMGTLVVHDVRPLARFIYQNQNTVTAGSTICVSPDGATLAVSSAEGGAMLWDPATGLAKATLVGHDSRHYRGVTSIRFSSDSAWIATGGHDGSVRIWNPRTGELLHVLTGHAGTVAQLAPGLEKTSLISVGEDGTLRDWNVSSGRPTAAIRVDAGLRFVDVVRGVVIASGDKGPFFFHRRSSAD